MKKLCKSVLIAAFVFSVLGLVAAEKTASAPAAPKQVNWTPFQLAFLPGVPGSTWDSTVYGLKLGIPATGGIGLVKGVEASFFYSGTRDVEGCQASWFGPAIAEDVYGIRRHGMAFVYRMTGFRRRTRLYEQPSKVPAVLRLSRG